MMHPSTMCPLVQTVVEDTPLIFSTGNGNAISVTDVDAGTSPMRITLTATNGTLTLSGTAGLTFTTGNGSADATMVFTGTLLDINTALSGLVHPTANYNGAASLQIISNDQGNTGGKRTNRQRHYRNNGQRRERRPGRHGQHRNDAGRYGVHVHGGGLRVLGTQ